MTTHATPAAGGAPQGVPPVGVSDDEVLVRAEGVELLGEMPGSGYRRPPALARRADGQVLQLTPLLNQVLHAVDGRRTVAEVADAASRATGRLVGPGDVHQLVAASLRPLGLLKRADGTEPELKRSDPLLALSLRKVITDPAVTRRLTAPFAVLFTPLLVVPVVLAFGAVAWWVLFSEGLAAATAQAFDNPALFVTVVLVTVLSGGFHEFGHAAAARYGGSTPGVMGFGFYLFWPAFYTDVTDSYRLGRGGRVRTDLGGLYFNALIVLVSFGVWWLTDWHAVLLIVATQVIQMIRQLAPLLRFDGYHVLADLTGVPDLYQRIGPVMRGLLPGRWHQPEATALKTWARVVVIAWVLVVVPLMAACLLLMVVALPRLLATAWAAMGEQADRLGADFGDGDVLGVLARVLAIVALVVPLLGIGYVLGRLVRRTAVGVWRRTEGRPVRRGLALLVAAALVAGLAWAWWPVDDRYRPVRAWEGGTVLDAVPASSSTGIAEGTLGTAATVWPADAGPLPTEDNPVLAMVLVPATQGVAEGSEGAVGGTDGGTDDGEGAGGAAPTWVFPFDRPLPPAEGDNQALAVNTEDGSVLYDVAFALVWAEGDEALNVNEAYALASCRDCRTVAVAFQVVLLVGSVDVVIPQNLSAAVNYACIECVTYALATQLVVTLPGELSAEGQEALAAIWAELQEFGENIEDVPLAELRDRLTEFEERILDVVQEHAEDPGEQPVEADDPDTGTSDDGTTDGTTTDGEVSDGDTGTSTDTSTDTDTSTGTDTGSTDGDGTSGSTGSTSTAEPTGSSAPTSSAPTSESTQEGSTPTETAPATTEATPTG